MREIDPIREPAEALLSSALHRLAKTGERSAPPELGSVLAARFRQHHRRRRMTHMALAGAMAASLVIAVLLLVRLRPEERRQVRHQPAVQERQAAGEPPAASAALPQKTQRHAVVQGSRQKASVEQSSMANAFIPLPAYDSALGMTDVRVVRMEVTGSDLMMVGAPVAADLAENRMLADFVVGSDGTPYAVRLVQQSTSGQ